MSAPINITSKQITWFKKHPVSVDTLPENQKARVPQKRIYRGCTPVGKKDAHTQLDMGSLGVWWVFDDHWLGLVTTEPPYAVKRGFALFKKFPLFLATR